MEKNDRIKAGNKGLTAEIKFFSHHKEKIRDPQDINGTGEPVLYIESEIPGSSLIRRCLAGPVIAFTAAMTYVCC